MTREEFIDLLNEFAEEECNQVVMGGSERSGRPKELFDKILDAYEEAKRGASQV